MKFNLSYLPKSLQSPLELIRLEGEGFHLLLKIYFQGIAMNTLLDTGASKTVFDRNEISSKFPELSILELDELSSGLGTNSMKGYMTQIHSIRIGNLEIGPMPISLLDLSHLQSAYSKLGLVHISGIIGNDILVKTGAMIDYDKKIIRFNRIS